MPDDRVADLLSAWQRQHAAGDVVTPEDLCKDTPELLPELQRRIDAIHWVERLAETTPGGDAAAADTGTLSDGRVPSFGDFTIIRQLGEGGMGRVLEAEDTRLGRRVAIKEMRPELAVDSGARERFLREARAAAAVRHDHIVPIYHIGENEGAPFLVMPLLAGESLAERLDRGALPPTEVARIGREAALGLAAAHAAGLVHRDIKPANIWLESPNDRVLILDFGLARTVDGVDALTRPGSVLGTPAYLAPEQANGLPLDARADLFSLGVTLYHAATGTRPFQGPTLTATLRAVAEHNPPPPHEVNPAIPLPLSDLIMRLLAKNSADRPASATVVADELAGHKETVAFSTPPVATQPRSSRQRWLIGGVVALLAVGLAIAVGTSHSPKPNETAKQPEPPPPQPTPTPTGPITYKGSVDLLVIRTDVNGSPLAVPLSDVRAWPLKPGDNVKVVAEVDPPAFVYLFWIDETGEAYPIHPWTPLKWGTRPPTEQKASKLELKDPNGNWFKIGGATAGMETLQMLVRSEPLQAGDDEVKGWFRDLRPLGFAGEKARVWFQGFDLAPNDPLRAPEYGSDTGQDNSPLGLQAVLRQRIGDKAGFSRAVSFARLGKKDTK